MLVTKYVNLYLIMQLITKIENIELFLEPLNELEELKLKRDNTFILFQLIIKTTKQEGT
jgi:hypothetical protein